MKKTSLAKAKARLSALVDAAEHRGVRIVILRHGKPAAALVPVDVAVPPPARERWPRRRVDEMLDRWAQLGDDHTWAVRDLLTSRR